MKTTLLALIMVFGMTQVLTAEEGVRSATIMNIQGDVHAKTGNSDWKLATVGMVLYVNDSIKTAENGFAELALDNGETGTVEIDSGSVFRLDTMKKDPETGDKTTLLDLAVGRVLVHAQKLKGQSKFEVKTPTSTAGVRGTTFEVVAEEV